MGQIYYKSHWKGWTLENETFLGPDMATSKSHELKITNVRVPVIYMALGLNDFAGGKIITQAIAGIKIITSRAI